MDIIKRVRRLGLALAGLCSALVAAAIAAPAAMAAIAPLPGGESALPKTAVHTVVRIVPVGGVAGWQVALIAIGAALVAAVAAVLLDRAFARTRANPPPIAEPA